MDWKSLMPMLAVMLISVGLMFVLLYFFFARMKNEKKEQEPAPQEEKEQESKPKLEIEECESNKANTLIYGPATKGLYYASVPEEFISVLSQPWNVQWIGKWLHFLVEKVDEKTGEITLDPWEPSDEIGQLPSDLLRAVRAEEVKTFFKMNKSLLEKVAIVALIVAIFGLFFFMWFMAQG